VNYCSLIKYYIFIFKAILKKKLEQKIDMLPIRSPIQTSKTSNPIDEKIFSTYQVIS